MNVMEAIRTRRSIRKFKDAPVPKQMMDDILEAGMYAPSAGNEQPWHFIVITDKSILAKVPDINPYAKMAKDAPVAVLVCGDLSLEKYPGNWPLDCSAAVQNMLLAAHGCGLGAVWTGVYPQLDRMRGFQCLFELPDNVIPHALIILGYPDEESRRPDRFKKDRIKENAWKS